MSCRSRAVELFRLAQKASEPFADDPASEQALLTDLLRRARRFDEARAESERGLRLVSDEIVESVLLYERRLIEGGDSARHGVDEAAAGDA